MMKVKSQKSKVKSDDRSLRILFIGDIVARIGRQTVKKVLPELKKEEGIDFVISNGENLTTGNGLIIDKVKEMLDAGIDYFTSGNHVWKKKDFIPYLDNPKVPVLRPANYPEGVPGRGSEIIKTSFGNILLINLMGREALLSKLDNPFKKIDEILEKTKNEKIVASVVDFHAELTSEKVAMGYFLNGKVSAIIGTHTHVPTADTRVLNKGTAFVSDVGMVGPLNSVLGVKSEIIIKMFLTGLPYKFEIAGGDLVFNSVLIEIDKKGKAKNIKRIDKIIEN